MTLIPIEIEIARLRNILNYAKKDKFYFDGKRFYGNSGDKEFIKKRIILHLLFVDYKALDSYHHKLCAFFIPKIENEFPESIKQDEYIMYGNSKFINIGHGFGTFLNCLNPNHPTADHIGARPELFVYYTKKLAEILYITGYAKKYDNTSLLKLTNTINRIVGFASKNENKSKRLDSVIAYEYEKNKNNNPKVSFYIKLPKEEKVDYSLNKQIYGQGPDIYGYKSMRMLEGIPSKTQIMLNDQVKTLNGFLEYAYSKNVVAQVVNNQIVVN